MKERGGKDHAWSGLTPSESKLQIQEKGLSEIRLEPDESRKVLGDKRSNMRPP